MQTMGNTLKQLKSIRFFGMLFIITFVTGLVVTNLFHDTLYPILQSFQTEFKENLKIYRLDQSLILRTAFLECLQYYILIIVFSFSNINTLFLIYFMGSRGLTQGILLASSIIVSGFGGVIEYFAYLCPQALFYVPAYLLLITACHEFNETIYSNLNTEKKGMFLKQVPFYLLLLMIICIGNFLEAYVNIPILKMILQ